MTDRFHGEEMVYHSFDCAVDDPRKYYPSKFLNTLTPNGLPPHLLKLKINCPVILLRNIGPSNGQHSGKRIFLPWITFRPSDDEMFPFQFKSKQFPIRLSFCMTINKAHGQTIPNAGIYLPEPVFSHGQLYVTLSRSIARTNIRVLAASVCDNKKNKIKWQKK
ncbi:hypothetical protein EJB05_27475, partial [Eragrostis curvula]